MSSSLSLEVLLVGWVVSKSGWLRRAGEGLELMKGALVGGCGGDVVMEEESVGRDGGGPMVDGEVVCVADLLSECGSVLFRVWAVVVVGCGLWVSRLGGLRGWNDGGYECIVDHLVSLVGDVGVLVGSVLWRVAWSGCGGVLGVVTAVVRRLGG